VVYFEKYTIGTLDHAAAITQIGAAKPDWIVATGYINDLILIRQQMADQKVTAKVITGINGPQYQEWIDAVGAVGNGVTTASWFHSSVRYKSDDLFGDTQNFVKLFPRNTSPSPTSPRRPAPPSASFCRWRSRRPAPSIATRCEACSPIPSSRRSSPR
jgi:branched-chain amino acid transport system substrate-binding protein